MTPETALIDAVVGLLVADADVAALVAGRIYDGPPAEVDALPYCHIGIVASEPSDLSGCGAITQVRIRIFAISGEAHRREAWEIAQAVGAALDEQSPALSPPYVLLARGIGIVRKGDIVDARPPRAVLVEIMALVAEP